MVDAHSSHKNGDFQALGSISPWLFATFWPKASIWSWVFWWWMPTRPIKMWLSGSGLNFTIAFWHFLTQNVNIIIGFLMVDAHWTHKNADFQALGSISPLLFGTCWPPISILEFVVWWWPPTGPIKTHTFRLWVQFHHGCLALVAPTCQYYHCFFDGGCPLVP